MAEMEIFIIIDGCHCGKVKSTFERNSYLILLSFTRDEPMSGVKRVKFINLIRAGGADTACTIFKGPFLHEKRVLEVPNFVTFPYSL